MSIHRRNVCALASLCASCLSTLALTASAQAANPPAAPSITSFAMGGSELTIDSAGSYYTNDPIDSNSGLTTDSFTVTVAGDPNASSIDIFYDGSTTLPSQTPDAQGNATFTIPSLMPTPHGSDDSVVVSQTVGGQTSAAGVFVFVGNVPVVDGIPVNNILAPDGALGVDTAIPGDPVEVFVDGHQTNGTANGSGFATGVAGGLSADYHTAYAKTVDAQGHASAASPTVAFYVAPVAPTIQTPVSNPNAMAFSNQNQPSITASGILAGATVNLYQIDDQGQPGPSLDSVTSANGGTVTLKSTTPAADGASAFFVTQTVSEGTGINRQSVTSDPNPSQQNNVLDLNIVTRAPSLITSFSGASTNDNKPGFLYALAGVYSSVAKVRLINANTQQTLGEGDAISGGEWVPTSPLADGHYSVYAVSIDDAGNVGTARSNRVTFTINTRAYSGALVAVALGRATSKTGVIELSAAKSTAPRGARITSYLWYLGRRVIGHARRLDFRVLAADVHKTVTLQVTDSAGDSSYARFKLRRHVHEAAVSLSKRILFSFDSARLTPAARRMLTKLRPAILASTRVTIDGYTAGVHQTRREKNWSAWLSARRAIAVEHFLFRGRVPAGLYLSVKGMGAAHDRAGANQDRRSSIGYARFVVTIDR